MVENLNTSEFLNCLVCLEYATDAVECEICSNIMCDECVKSLKKRECPACRQVNFNAKPSALARKMIKAIPIDCTNSCGAKTNIGNLSDHLKKCPNKQFTCTSDNC
jgi:hypothetical protein